MKQVLFETRQKAEELLREALAIWRQGDHADDLEGIEQDPVISLLMMAFAYRSNETDSEIERLKAEVLEDFSRMLVPYEMGHATPATAVVETVLQDDVAELTLGEGSVFKLSAEHPFIPLLQTRALNATVRSVVRLDGRRWKVSLGFRHPVSDLSRFAFAIRGVDFRNVAVSLKGQLLPLVKPWHYSELPLTPCFSPESMTYNLGQQSRLSNLPMDLFARQNVRLFIVEDHKAQKFLPTETEQLDLVFEFTGIPDDFRFDKTCLCLNPVMLVNAQIREASLSAASPVVRLAGGESNPVQEKDLTGRQFLHLIRPPENQIFGNTELEIRGVAGDRFNPGSLMKLLNCIITRYHSDYYAFRQIPGPVSEDAVFQLEAALSRLRDENAQNALGSVSGIYLMPRREAVAQKKDFSLNVRYLTTAGAAVNSLLSTASSFTAPSGFKSAETRVMAAPVPGTDEIRDETALGSLMRYYMVTGDRLVTMADIKLFCYKELMVRYGIGGELVRRLRLNRRQQQDASGCGYEIVAEITLTGNPFVKRSFAGKLSMAEILMQKMIEVRSANIYPVRVNITIENE